MMRRRRELIGWSGTVLLVGLAVACSINPQPLPPDAPGGYDAGSSSTTEPGSGGSAVNAAADASATLSAGEDAGIGDAVDAAAPEELGDGGDGGDASELDAGTDAAEEDASDASDAG